MADFIVLVTLASHLKRFGVADVIDGIPPELLHLHRKTIELDTAPYHDDSDGGDWTPEDAYLRDSVQRVCEACGQPGFRGCYVFSLAEVPSLIAFGAYCGDRIPLVMMDWDRDRALWRWPNGDQALTVNLAGLPQDVVRSTDPVVIRLELSATVTDEQVAAMVGVRRSADIRIRPKGPADSRVGLLQAVADTVVLRNAVRQVMGSLTATRPLTDTLHVFVAASCAASVIFGQELQLRNLSAVQTYRFRPGREAEAYSEGIMLREWPVEAPRRLTAEEHALATELKTTIWPEALEQVRRFAGEMARDTPDSLDWRETLRSIPGLLDLPGLPAVPPLYRHMDLERDAVSAQPYSAREYGYDKEARLWRFRDDTVLGLWRAAAAIPDTGLAVARLFLFHEYLHDYHGLRKLAAAQVGSFPNVLERIDYVADLFALLHQLELAWRGGLISSEESARRYLADQIDLALRSIAAFAGRPPHDRVQERTLRRRLNWHWRLTQVRRSPSLEVALLVLSRQPAIEISGLVHEAGARRIYVRLNRLDVTTDLAIGLVTEDDTFGRVVTQAAADLRQLVAAFRTADHQGVQEVMSAVFEQVGQAALPHRRS